MKNNKKQTARMKSGFVIFDLLTGGYPAGTVTVLRTIGGDIDEACLQRFMERQVLRMSLPEPCGMNKSVLLLSLGMDSETVAKSLFLENNLYSHGPIMKANLMVSSSQNIEQKSLKAVREDILSTIREYVSDSKCDCVVIDDIGKALPAAIDSEVGLDFSADLAALAIDAGVTIIVTDYENKWETPWDMTGDYTGCMDICVNEDVRGRTQMEVHSGKTAVTIEDVYGVETEAGLEMLRMMMEKRKNADKEPFAVNDEAEALALSAALLVEKINDIFNNPN